MRRHRQGCYSAHIERVAIGRSPRCSRSADRATAATAIVDDELLSHGFVQTLTDHARKNIGRTAGDEGNDDAHRARGVLLCMRIKRAQATGTETR